MNCAPSNHLLTSLILLLHLLLKNPLSGLKNQLLDMQVDLIFLLVVVDFHRQHSTDNNPRKFQDRNLSHVLINHNISPIHETMSRFVKSLRREATMRCDAGADLIIVTSLMICHKVLPQYNYLNPPMILIGIRILVQAIILPLI